MDFLFALHFGDEIFYANIDIVNIDDIELNNHHEQFICLPTFLQLLLLHQMVPFHAEIQKNDVYSLEKKNLRMQGIIQNSLARHKTGFTINFK